MNKHNKFQIYQLEIHTHKEKFKPVSFWQHSNEIHKFMLFKAEHRVGQISSQTNCQNQNLLSKPLFLKIIFNVNGKRKAVKGK